MGWVSKATDDFNRANEAPLSGGGNWTTQTGESAWNLVSNKVQPSSSPADCTSVYTGRSWAADQYSKLTITTTGAFGSGAGYGICVRALTASRSKYRLVIDRNLSNNLVLVRFNGASNTQLNARTISYVDGAVLELRVTGTGTSTQLEVLYNTASIYTFTDNSGSALNSGSPGISYSSDDGIDGQDTWDGGEFIGVAASDDPPIGLLGMSAGW